MIRVDAYGLTDRGRVRSDNQDQFLIAELCKSMLIRQTSLGSEDQTRLSSGRRGHLFAVADGMGGRPAGERASSIAVDSIIRYVLNVMPWFYGIDNGEQDMREHLAKAMQRSQKSIEAETAGHPDREGMGTTLTLAYVLWPRLHIVHVGDSRCYLWRAGRMTRARCACG